MALVLTDKLKTLAEKPNKEVQVILEIDGIDLYFGARPVIVFPKFDEELYFDENVYFDTGYASEKSRDYLNIDKSTNHFTQQIEIDKGGFASVGSMVLALIDKGQEISKLFALKSNNIDILGRKAKIYLNFFNGGIHKEDSVTVLNGVISGLTSGAGHWLVTVDHSQQLLRQKIFLTYKTKLSAPIDDSVTTIPVVNANQFLVGSDDVSTFIKIEDEIIQYTGKTSTSFTGCTRGALGTVAAAHSVSECSAVYRLQGNMVDIALKLLVSGSGYIDAPLVYSFNYQVSNSIFFPGIDLVKEMGIVIGDKIKTIGAINAGNNIDADILDIFIDETGTYITPDTSLILETDSTASASIKSQYDVYPIGAGLGLDSSQVDIAGHLFWKDVFSSQILDYDFVLTEEIEGSEFLAKEIYYPQSAYSVPRLGRVSMNITAPSLGVVDVKTIDKSNAKKPETIQIKRSTNKYLYNAIVYKFDPTIEGEFTSGIIYLSPESRAKIAVGDKPLTIESNGLRASGTTEQFLNIQSRRMLERYKFAPEYLTIDVFFSIGFSVDVGDAIILDSEGLSLTDIDNGNRKSFVKVYEVVNKDLSIKSGEVKLTLLNANRGLNGRNGVIAPSSYVDINSTTTKIRLKKSFTTPTTGNESDKWNSFLNHSLIVRKQDFSSFQTCKIVSASIEKNTLNVTGLSIAPDENDVVCFANYSDVSTENRKAKAIYCSFNPTVFVTSGASNTVFDVDDPSKLFVGATIEVRNSDFTLFSPEVSIADITGSTVTVDNSLGFVPGSDYIISLVGFKDGGLPYRVF